MAQRAEQHPNRDFQDSYGQTPNQTQWVWGVLAAIVALALIVWYVTASGPDTGPRPSATTEQTAPPPASSATTNETTPAPAPAPAQPAQPSGGQTGQ